MKQTSPFFLSQTTPQFTAGNGIFAQLHDLQNKSQGNEELQFCDGDMRVVISNLLLAGKTYSRPAQQTQDV